MKFFRFFVSKTLFANILLALLTVALAFLGLSYGLDYYTRHGQAIPVPDLSDMAVTEAAAKLKSMELQYQVLDSAEYNPHRPRGAVVEQFPQAGSTVKAGRVVKLTLNRMQPRKILIPDIIDKTKRRAIYDLESKGFEVRDLEYVPYIGKDVVVDLKVEGESVKIGGSYPEGTAVTLVLGEGLGKQTIPVPYLRWLSAEEARAKLLSSRLNPGALLWDEDISDTAAALVYRQSPEPTRMPAIQPGEPVDIWLTNDYTKIPNDSLEFQQHIPDSLNDSFY